MKPDTNIDQLGPTKSLFKFGFVKEFSPITRKALIEPIANLIDKATELMPSFKMLFQHHFHNDLYSFNWMLGLIRLG